MGSHHNTETYARVLIRVAGTSFVNPHEIASILAPNLWLQKPDGVDEAVKKKLFLHQVSDVKEESRRVVLKIRKRCYEMASWRRSCYHSGTAPIRSPTRA